MVLAYMIRYANYTLHDAFIYLRAARPVVTPNLGFMDKLVAYEDTGIFKTISLGRNRHVVLDEYENGLVTIRASLTT